MLFKELLNVYHMANVKIYINGALQETKSSWDYDQFNDYEVRRIAPCCEATGQLSLSKGITVEPYLEIHLNSKIKEVYEVETGRLDEKNIEFGYKFVGFDTYEEAKEYYDNYLIWVADRNYKTLFKITLQNEEELYRDIVEQVKKTS